MNIDTSIDVWTYMSLMHAINKLQKYHNNKDKWNNLRNKFWLLVNHKNFHDICALVDGVIVCENNGKTSSEIFKTYFGELKRGEVADKSRN